MKALTAQLATVSLAVVLLGCGNTQSALSGMVPVIEAKQLVDHGAVLIDVRTPDEFQAGHVAEAVNIPYEEIDKAILKLAENPDQEIILYCSSGRRAAEAKRILEDKGFHKVYNSGGYDSWIE